MSPLWRVLAIILEMAAVDLDALAAAYERCVLTDSLWSISTPRYLTEALVSIGVDPTRIVAFSTVFLLLMSTA